MVYGIIVGIEICWPQGLASASVSLFLVRGILNFFAPIWFPVDGRESLGKVRGGEKGLWRPPRPTIHPPFPAPFPTPPDPPTQNIGINRVGIDSELSRAWLVSSRWTGCLFCTNQCQLPSTILDPTIVNCLVSHIAHRTSHIAHRTSYYEIQNTVEKCKI